MNNKQNNYDSITYISLSFEQYNVFFAFTIKKVGLMNSFFNPSRVFNASSLGSGSSIENLAMAFDIFKMPLPPYSNLIICLG